MNDLSQLFELNPYVASGFQGQREALSQGNDQLKNQELAQLIGSRMQDQKFKADQHPIDLQRLLLANQQTEAQIPGFAADSRKKGLEADLKAGTLGTDIEEGNSKNNSSIYQRVGTHLGTLAGHLEGVSDIEAPMILSQGLDALGASPKVKQAFMQRYGRLPVEQMRQKLQEDGDAALAATPEMAKAGLETSARMTEQRQAHESAERVAMINGGYRVEAANARGGKTPATVEDMLRKAKTAKEKAEILEQAVEESMAANDMQAAAIYQRRAELARQRAAEDASNQGLGSRQTGINAPGLTGLPANPAPAATAPATRGTAPAPTANRQPSVNADGRVRIIGPDGKGYTIPKEQLQDALKQGYQLR